MSGEKDRDEIREDEKVRWMDTETDRQTEAEAEAEAQRDRQRDKEKGSQRLT